MAVWAVAAVNVGAFEADEAVVGVEGTVVKVEAELVPDPPQAAMATEMKGS